MKYLECIWCFHAGFLKNRENKFEKLEMILIEHKIIICSGVTRMHSFNRFLQGNQFVGKLHISMTSCKSHYFQPTWYDIIPLFRDKKNIWLSICILHSIRLNSLTHLKFRRISSHFERSKTCTNTNLEKKFMFFLYKN